MNSIGKFADINTPPINHNASKDNNGNIPPTLVTQISAPTSSETASTVVTISAQGQEKISQEQRHDYGRQLTEHQAKNNLSTTETETDSANAIEDMIGELNQQIREIMQQIQQLQNKQDSESQQQLELLQNQLMALNSQLMEMSNQQLNELK